MRAEWQVQSVADGADVAPANRLVLDINGTQQSLHLKIMDLTRAFVQELDPRIADLAEIAGAVYAADSANRRGGPTAQGMGKDWRRDLSFQLDVRCLELCGRPEVTDTLCDVLGILSGDTYAFDFNLHPDPPAIERFLELGDDGGLRPDTVLLFSGGLDSFAGALEEAVTQGRRMALVSHRSAPQLAPVQRRLVSYLDGLTEDRRVQHIPVTAHLAGRQAQELTHRTRSFLFAALGAAVARLSGIDLVRFYENGVVSMNLPIGGHVVGTRATRSTHPRVLSEFGRLFSLVFDRNVAVDNPFFSHTKADVIDVIRRHAATDQIRHTRSCANVRAATRQHPHCGTCSQCVDRRLSIKAVGLEHTDPAEAYKTDILVDPLEGVQDREMALAYLRNARLFQQMSETDLFIRFPEVTNAVADLGQTKSEGLRRIHQLHLRHGTQISVLRDQLLAQLHATGGASGLPDGSLLRLVGQDVFGGPSFVDPLREHPGGRPQQADVRWRVNLDRTRPNTLVLIAGLGEVGGVSGKVLETFADAHIAAQGRGLAPEDHPCVSAGDLSKAWALDSEESVRKRVSTARRQIKKLARQRGITPPADDAIIENLPWHGYRLNPARTIVRTKA